MQSIMLATDFSERSAMALRRAVLLARDTGAAIDLVHVVDDDQPRHIIESQTAHALTLLSVIARSLEAEDKLHASKRVVSADPFVGLKPTIDDAGPDLLVIGAHRRRILRDAFAGTTAERTIRSAACPVLMVTCPPVGSYRSALLTTDLSEGSSAALRWFDALAIGAETQAILHVFEAPALRLAMSGVVPKDSQDNYLGGLHTEARRNLSVFMARTGVLRAQPIARHRKTTVAQTILTVADEAKSDLIIASTHCQGFVTRTLLGSVTEQILRASPVDVLAVPPGREP